MPSPHGAVDAAHAAAKRRRPTRSEMAEYQRASLENESAFDGSLWINQCLTRYVKQGAFQRGASLLDVGAIRGDRYVEGIKPLRLSRVRAIDLNVLDGVEGVERCDLMDVADGPYDVVCLSLVLNFEPDPRRRGELLYRASALLGKLGEERAARRLFVVLPRACFENARYFSYDQWNILVDRFGLATVESTTTEKLFMTVLAGKPDVALPLRPERVPRRKVKYDKGEYNNFTILFRSDGSHAEAAEKRKAEKRTKKKRRNEDAIVGKTTSNQRKRARLKALKAANKSVGAGRRYRRR